MNNAFTAAGAASWTPSEEQIQKEMEEEEEEDDQELMRESEEDEEDYSDAFDESSEVGLDSE